MDGECIGHGNAHAPDASSSPHDVWIKRNAVKHDRKRARVCRGERLDIALDIVRLRRRLGARTIFATHLHALAADVAALHASSAGDSLMVSLVASRTEAGDDGLH